MNEPFEQLIDQNEKERAIMAAIMLEVEQEGFTDLDEVLTELEGVE